MVASRSTGCAHERESLRGLSECSNRPGIRPRATSVGATEPALPNHPCPLEVQHGIEGLSLLLKKSSDRRQGRCHFRMIRAEGAVSDCRRATGKSFADRKPSTRLFEQAQVVEDVGDSRMLAAKRLLGEGQRQMLQARCFCVETGARVQESQGMKDRGHLGVTGTKGLLGHPQRLLQDGLRLAAVAEGEDDAGQPPHRLYPEKR